jgi:hypothetical protein
MRRFHVTCANLIKTSLLLILALVTTGCGAQKKAQEIQSMDHMKKLATALIEYAGDNEGRYPDSLDQVKEYCKEKPYDVLIENPFTGDNPGYEYVKPAEDAKITETVVLYQLKGGSRATEGKVAYLDGSVRAAP